MRKWLSHVAAATILIGVPLAAVHATNFAILLGSSSRTDEDRARDADRKPAELMNFARVRRGMKIVELAPGGGYFTRLLSLAIGSNGRLIAFSNRASPVIEAWAAAHPNTTMTVGGLDTPLANEPVDLVWTTLNYHDFKNLPVEGGGDAAARINASAFAALRPGGTYLVVDHEAAPGAGTSVTSTLHRIESAAVIREVEAAGFRLDRRSNILRHPEDDHTQRVFETGIRGRTDQFVLRFVKPRGRRR